jgi:hypothetical protein
MNCLSRNTRTGADGTEGILTLSRLTKTLSVAVVEMPASCSGRCEPWFNLSVFRVLRDRQFCS